MVSPSAMCFRFSVDEDHIRNVRYDISNGMWVAVMLVFFSVKAVLKSLNLRLSRLYGFQDIQVTFAFSIMSDSFSIESENIFTYYDIGVSILTLGFLVES